MHTLRRQFIICCTLCLLSSPAASAGWIRGFACSVIAPLAFLNFYDQVYLPFVPKYIEDAEPKVGLFELGCPLDIETSGHNFVEYAVKNNSIGRISDDIIITINKETYPPPSNLLTKNPLPDPRYSRCIKHIMGFFRAPYWKLVFGGGGIAYFWSRLLSGYFHVSMIVTPITAWCADRLVNYAFNNNGTAFTSYREANWRHIDNFIARLGAKSRLQPVLTLSQGYQICFADRNCTSDYLPLYGLGLECRRGESCYRANDLVTIRNRTLPFYTFRQRMNYSHAAEMYLASNWFADIYTACLQLKKLQLDAYEYYQWLNWRIGIDGILRLNVHGYANPQKASGILAQIMVTQDRIPNICMLQMQDFSGHINMYLHNHGFERHAVFADFYNFVQDTRFNSPSWSAIRKIARHPFVRKYSLSNTRRARLFPGAVARASLSATDCPWRWLQSCQSL